MAFRLLSFALIVAVGTVGIAAVSALAQTDAPQTPSSTIAPVQTPSASLDEQIRVQVEALNLPPDEKQDLMEKIAEALNQTALSEAEVLALLKQAQSAIEKGQLKPEDVDKLVRRVTALVQAGVPAEQAQAQALTALAAGEEDEVEDEDGDDPSHEDQDKDDSPSDGTLGKDGQDKDNGSVADQDEGDRPEPEKDKKSDEDDKDEGKKKEDKKDEDKDDKKDDD